ncbi:Vegetative incompatibility protein HET-E-1 [Grifola frondosa]|uniref:Vegetative incompatibility protein HET-E-1 n=1 Tax=Grifola frondosa TaxID=5627 RepID=A0A1C7MD29_GRIFR|nr:Vegetative incompatibility protein HET-E-1 [Grifola frondosa]
MAETVYLWDGDSGELRHTLAGHRGHIQSVAFFPEDTMLVIADHTLQVRIWDVRSGTCSQVVDISSRHTADLGRIDCMTISLAGHRLAVGISNFGRDRFGLGMTDGQIFILDCSNWHTLALAVVSFPDDIGDICFSPRGDRLVSASTQGTILIYDTAAMEGTTYIESNWLSPQGWHGAVAFTSDGTQIATYSGYSQGDSAIDVWTSSSGTFVHSWKRPVPYDESPISYLRFTNSEANDQLGIIMLTHGQRVLLRDVTTWTLKASTPEVYGRSQVFFSRDGQYLATATISGTVTMRKTSDLSECWTADLPSFGELLQDIRITPDRTNVLVYYPHGARRRLKCVLNFSTGELVERIYEGLEIALDEMIPNWDHLGLDRAGWIYSRESRRKLCWLPPVLRPANYYKTTSCNNHFAIVSSNDCSPLTVVNLSSLIETSARTASTAP